eukprot:GILJ01008106.1.p1 GENE.GILJ01008106.1~~GILJ01008106.1.p1  ORF type:complete len:193 (-),score=22.59 GILJ01008106.1:80-658(-)
MAHMEPALSVVFAFLPLPVLAHVARVSSQWKTVAYLPHFWCYLTLEPFLKNMDEMAVTSLLSRCSQLQALSLRGLDGTGDAILSCLGAHCPELQVLDLSFSYNLNGSSLSSLASCSRLRLLQLEGCENVRDEDLLPLAASLPIAHLNLSHCTLVTGASIPLFPRLVHLNIDGCPKTNQGLISRLAQGYDPSK